MSDFTETELLKRLQEMDASQQSIQKLSLWIIHHRKHHSVILNTWYRELLAAPELKKLTLMYLAHDVIFNCKTKGPECGLDLCTILHKVFKHIGEVCKTEKVFRSISHVLKIWEKRFVYDQKTIDEFSAELYRESVSRDEETTDCKENPMVSEKQEKDEKQEKEKRQHGDANSKSKRARTSSGSDEGKKHSESDASGSSSATDNADNSDNATIVSVNISPHIPLGEPSESEEIIEAQTDIENSASSDAVVGERIASLPAEIPEIS